MSTERDFPYFLTVVDDHSTSRTTWLYLLRSKDEAILHIHSYLSMIKIQFDKSVKVFRSDNGLHFCNALSRKLFDGLGIIHQTICVGSTQQNGIVERKHRHLLEAARALKLQLVILDRYWDHCVLIVRYLINIMPSKLLHNKSPYEVLYGHSTLVQHLCVFGSLCYATVLHDTDKFTLRYVDAVMLGYSPTQKGYKLLNLVTKVIFMSQDVVLKEQVFPFAETMPSDFGVHLESNQPSSKYLIKSYFFT